jgi:hypothetical protein
LFTREQLAEALALGAKRSGRAPQNVGACLRREIGPEWKCASCGSNRFSDLLRRGNGVLAYRLTRVGWIDVASVRVAADPTAIN